VREHIDGVVKTERMTVLIVDDSSLIIDKILELLADLKTITKVEACGTYAHAVKAINNFIPDIVILDINLPDKSGIELLKYLRSKNTITTVIMCTNQSGDNYRDMVTKLGANFFLDKSKDFEKLPSLITSLF
jgi:DNA-binding NarL/FixJ family response regulator